MTPALRKACEKALHVVRADGSILRGGPASLYVFEQCGQRWAKLAAARPFGWPVERIYRLIASNRRFFARFAFRKKSG